MGFLITEMGLSERRACRIVGLARSVQQYRPVPKDDTAVVKRMKALASENRRYGYLRLHAMLRREGLVVNHTRKALASRNARFVCRMTLFLEGRLKLA
ncbi:IS3 family transposase [Rhodovulum sulfidophilum]|uniref:IS3 family transposase n=1 Tax=Rhodovulum sulfidophilum TaxID=35806 RepID=UPI00138A0DB8|nr:IS3 family transposase [Rhodovulum sulfidophilum]